MRIEIPNYLESFVEQIATGRYATRKRLWFRHFARSARNAKKRFPESSRV